VNAARAKAAVTALLLALGLISSAAAHVASSGFLTVQVEGRQITGAIELAVRDTELAVGVDADGDGKITWAELSAAQSRLSRYITEHLLFSTRAVPCEIELGTLRVNDRVDGAYAWLPYTARCAESIRLLGIRYTLLEGIDPTHRGLLTLTAGPVAQTGVLGGSTPQTEFLVSDPSAGRAFVEYFRAGVTHILSGIDHLLFLLSLLLPAVLLRAQDRWHPVTEARPALLNILKVVTAFTLAHSITLTLAALDIVRLPTRLTESVIAASIVIAALNNIFPWVTETRARIAFAFGLLHGFGFASVLADMGLPSGARLVSLAAFNLGIEAGQLAVVATVMPLIYALRGGTFYRRALMPWGSAAIAVLALVWLFERAVLAPT
jgi:hypothetical protein